MHLGNQSKFIMMVSRIIEMFVRDVKYLPHRMERVVPYSGR